MKINALILGKSGVGKSALLNYLWGGQVAAVGAGRPVTPQSDGDEVGLYEHSPVTIDGHQLVIFDSWGLEADQADKWTKTVTSEIEKRERSSNLEDWFHAVVYCVSAASARIEDFEIEKVIRPLAVQGQAITFVLTKADAASDDEIAALEQAIRKAYPGNGGIIKVCSEEKVLRGGRLKARYGKDELFSSLTRNLAIKLRSKLTAKYVEKCREVGTEWKNISLSFYDDEASFLQSTGTTLKIIENKVKFELDVQLSRANTWMRNSVEKVESLESALQRITSSQDYKRVDGSAVFCGAEIQWDFLDHLAAFGKHLIPLFNIYHLFTAKETYRVQLSEKLDATVSEIVKAASDIASTRLLSIIHDVPNGAINTSTTERPESTVRIRRALAGNYD